MRQSGQLARTQALASMLGAFALLGACSQSRQVEFEVSIAGTGALRLWECTDEDAVLTVEDDRGEGARGPRALSVTPVSSAVVATRSGSIGRDPILTGVVTNLGTGRDGLRWATLTDPSELDGQVALMVRESEIPGWRRVPVPLGTRGALLLSAAKGYAWRDAEVLRTENAGKTWGSFGRVRIGRVSPGRAPLVSSTGDLWVPIGKPGGDAAIGVLRQSGELGVQFHWPGESLDSLRWGSPGILVIALGSTDGRGFRIILLDENTGRQRVVLSREDGALWELRVRGVEMALHQIGMVTPRGPLEHGKGRLLVSRDAGKTWDSRDIRSDDFESICISGGGMWAASSRTRRLRWLPK